MSARRRPHAPLGSIVEAAPPRVRIWQGIEAEDPPFRRHDYADLLAMAESMLEARRHRLPALVERRAISARAAAENLAAFEAIVADWRWIVLGEGEPAPFATLAARRAALDESLRTIADIARDQFGFSEQLARQAECVIALAWHLDPGRRTHALAAITHAARADAPAAAERSKADGHSHAS